LQAPIVRPTRELNIGCRLQHQPRRPQL